MRRPLVVLWLATLLFYLGFQLLLPVVPLYATELGAGGGSILLGLCATRLGYAATWWIAAAIAGVGAAAAPRPGGRPRG